MLDKLNTIIPENIPNFCMLLECLSLMVQGPFWKGESRSGGQ